MGRKEVAAIVSIWVIPISVFVNRIVPDPYLDETFHIPQALQYCNVNFRSWEPVITTSPGLCAFNLHFGSSVFGLLMKFGFNDPAFLTVFLCKVKDWNPALDDSYIC